MIGASQAQRGWAAAGALSVLLHGAAAVALVWQPQWPWPAPARDQPVSLQLDLTSLPTAAVDAPTLTPVETAVADATGGETLAPVSQPDQPAPDSPSAVLSPLLSDPPLATVQTLPDMPGDIAAGGPGPAPQDSAPADPRISQLFDRIRGRLSESCLLALPAMLGEDQIQLGVLAADDRRISGLMDELTQDLDAQIVESAVLLDRRQCPALDFARRDPRYPVLGLGLQLDSQDVASGGNLRGSVAGAAGMYTTLLLIDDNGVVHDMRRFQIASVGQTHFDVPLARSGPARDTHQLVMAIASPSRPRAVNAHAGELAEDFFDRLASEMAADTRIGIGSVYVR